MFYYPNVLQRHTGCFSTVWFAATRGTRVTRRELLKVNVKRTCGDIVDYVTAQVPALQPNLPRPRFSLYLSAQLHYGVVVVYHRQCSFLLEEAQQTMERLLRSKRCVRIDLPKSDRLALDLPDNLYMMEEAEGAQDPFFGVMELNQLPSPYKIQQPMLMVEEEASQHSLLSSLHNTPDKEGFRSPPAAITLTEKEQLHTPTAECFEGDDLPEVTAREIDLLLDQPDQFRGDMEGKQAEERVGDLEGAMSSINQLRETVLGAERDSVWLLDEDSGQPVEVPLAAVAREMTPLHVTLPPPPSCGSGRGSAAESPREEVLRPLKKPGGGRRRQLVFADPEVQISDQAMQEQISYPQAETVNLAEVLLDLPSLTKHPAQLFTAPCGSLHHTDLQTLWKKCATLATYEELWREEREEEEVQGGSEQDREILRAERKRRQSSMKEISSESGLQPAEGSSVLDVILNMSKEDKSVSDIITPVGRWSPQEEALLQMEAIEEENIEMPEAENDAESRDMLSFICSSLQRFGGVTFVSLVPPEADRTTAAQTLYKLLELLSAGHVTARQAEPYSPININPAGLRTTA
ncbi:REC8 meiotic recombination protein b isoform X2 [Notolabrus celidotus]|uniref:REC8 meiotic recombination protein b isoform X2 n=1 Tax=Notolabrus celidotus TaxID=1203425 RepID=UPI0014904055|nr:REC8 meiotic recombination protein b isoform X2 [Notolabrus celidotus]